MVGSGMNLITTVIGFGMSATFIVFVCTRIICGRLRRNIESRPMFEIESRIDLEQPEHNTTGLEPVLVAAIPTMKFNQEAFSSIDDTQCSICLSEYEEKEVLRIMPKCGHNFHLSCIDVWLRKQSTCPVCRLPLKESLGGKHTRPVMFSFSRIQSFEGSEITNEHSQQWLLPGNESSIVNNNINNDNNNSNNNENHSNIEEEEMSVPERMIRSDPTTSGEPTETATMTTTTQKKESSSSS